MVSIFIWIEKYQVEKLWSAICIIAVIHLSRTRIGITYKNVLEIMINQQRMILAQSVNGSLCARIIPFCQVTVPVLKTLINDELI